MNPTPSTPDVPAEADRPVILIGAGDHARVLIDVLHVLGRKILYATDHNPQVYGSTISGVLVKGGDEHVLSQDPDQVVLINAVGSVHRPIARQRVFEMFHAKGYHFGTLIHPSAVIASSVALGEGAQIMAGVIIQPAVTIGPNSLINTRASIDHDCAIGAHVHVAPGVVLSGGVHVQDGVHIGTGAIVIQRIRIGAGAVVGAGSVAVRSVPDETVVVGVPAQPMSAGPKSAGKASPSGLSRQPTDKTMRVMISASGRRVVLMRLFQQAVAELGLDAQVIATDVNRLSSAFHLAEEAELVPRYAQPGCLEHLLALCRGKHVGLIVPTIDPDLDFYSQYMDVFAHIGTSVLLSDPRTITIGNDKQRTHDWLVETGLPTVRQTDLETLRRGKAGDWQYPMFVKPRFGSSSIGARTIEDMDQLHVLPQDVPYIVQSLARGREYTVDVYLDRQGCCRCAVPRLRLETRGGEVSKGMTCRCQPVQDLAKRVAEALPGGRGVMNIQIFYDHKSGDLNVIEINPRFGGGYPLAHEAGAPMTHWVLQEALDLPCAANDEQWRDGVVMLRYDEAVFVTRGQAGVDAFGQLQEIELPPPPEAS